MRYLIILALAFGLIGSLVKAEEEINCIIIDCPAWQYKVCGKIIYSRDYSCENACIDKNIKEFRFKENSPAKEIGVFDFDVAIEDWNKLSKYLKKNRCGCEVVWILLESEEEKKEAKHWIRKYEKKEKE